jgi:hypothetical protein
MKDDIVVLNYTQEAIRDLTTIERNILATHPYTSHVIRNLIKLLSDSTKFILPNCADFVDSENFTQTHLDLARLPYPVVAFETPWVKETPLEQYRDFPVSLSTKRIALCIEYTEEHKHLCPVPNLGRLLRDHPEGGALVFSIYYSDDEKLWIASTGGSFVPFNNKVQKAKGQESAALPSTRIAYEQLMMAGKITSKNPMHFFAEPFVALPEFAAQMQSVLGSREKLFSDIILNTRDEVFAYIGACSLLNCANVIIEKAYSRSVSNSKLPPSARKKLKPQPKPKFEYKILQITEERTSSTKSTGVTGSESSPRRTHLRRGHLRRLSEKTVWVRPSVINPGSTSGFLAKDYSVRTKNND